ncbi:hypothetical protein [Cesiribacter andamanensis]|uniref:YhhN-like protein n=1 Tax=Cesiribacter andamanensis AMV16 TaxID=1279009 RepID=M7N2B7_9BACT|nr:hypothetical protein [Cesiribacter andamanensis]EMR01351.1 hypothetical protein ADICEAN_03531 [Cesiribacter andamanensis AMV16]
MDSLKRDYFFWVSVFLLVLSLIGFSDNLFFDVGQESNSDPKFIVHGLFFLAWFLLLVGQSWHIRKKNYRTHIALGSIGMLIGLGVVLSTFWVFVAVYEGWAVMPEHVKANRFLTASFALLVLLAYLYRKYGAWHKRFLLMGTIYVLGPVIGRVADKLGAESLSTFVLYEAVIWNGLFISLFIYDWSQHKTIHPISWVGYLWFYGIWLLCSFV